MNNVLVDEILKEGIEALYSKLGTFKTLKFLQLVGAGHGDSVREIEDKTRAMSIEDILNLVETVKRNNSKLWRKMGLL